MSAHPTPEELAEHAEGLLEKDDARTLEAHLAGCATCHTVRADLDTLRAVLAADRPGPMPAEVTARLDAAFTGLAADELSVVRHRQRETAGEAGAKDGQRTSRRAEAVAPVDLAERRARYRRYRRIGSVAAGLVLVVGGSVLGVQVARDTGTQSASSGGADRATALTEESARGPAFSPGQDAPMSTSSGRAYTEAGFAAQVAALLRPATARDSTAAAPPEPTVADGGSAGAAPADIPAVDAETCASDLAARTGRPGVSPVAIDMGTWNGKPAVVVVLPEPGTSASVHAYVISHDCVVPGKRPGDAAVLHDKVLPRP